MIYKIKFYNRKVINLDITHRCPLECPKCVRQIYRNHNIKIPGTDMSMKHFEMFLKYFDKFIFCGQQSDPIFHPKFLHILKRLKEEEKITNVHTAASHKSFEWFETAFKTYTGAGWTFGIDGLPKDSHKYRINQDGEKLFKVMLMASKILKPKNTTWQYIVFKYNENNIETCKKIAKENNIKFKLVYSSRFTNEDEYKPKEINYVSRTDWNIL